MKVQGNEYWFFELEIFFQTILKNFLCATHPWLKYLRGAFDLVVYASKKIRNIGHTNLKIFKETSTMRGFSKSILKSKELNVGEYSFLFIFELRNFFQRLLKKFLYAIHPWLKYFRGAFDLVVYAGKKIRNIGRTNPKIFNKTVRGEKRGVFSLFPFPI